jgi:tight adherence protein C
MDASYLIAALLAIVVGLFIYALFMPRNMDSFRPALGDAAKDNPALRLAAMLGTELYSTLPSGLIRKDARKQYPRIQSLIRRSGNPWNIRAEEFVFFQYVMAFMGFVVGWPVWLLLSTVIQLPWFVVVVGATVLGFFIPTLKYADQAKRRDLEFKRQLPEALDLLSISVASGASLQNAMRESIPNMQDGVLKEEFRDVLKALDLGKTQHEALDVLADRAPNESIATFVRSVQEATALNVPLIEILESRSDASRQEFYALIQKKTATLESKMMAALAPTLMPALLIILLTPSMFSLISSLGGTF